MKVTILQMDIAWCDPAANRENARRMIESEPGSDLYLLPEMWSTGFVTKPEGVAESDDGESLRWMKEMAKQTNAAICGSIAVCESETNTYRNRFYFVKPDGEVVYYDKHHLFTHGGEHHTYTAGTERVVVEFRGVRFLLLVCYDLRFPMWARNHEDYDAIMYVASWPTPRVEAWKALLRARAIENQCYVLGANRVGTDPTDNYVGGSSFVDPYGKVSLAPDNKQSGLSGTISMDTLEAFRIKFPVLKDRD